MRQLRVSFGVLAIFIVTVAAQAQEYVQPDSLGLPGDNLNLYAVLRVFQESPTLEEFEKKLNDEKSMINNLDLDGDGNTDYIRVVDNVSASDSVHSIVLQVPVSKEEAQDVAVIVVDRDASGQVYIQVIGDEDLYGPDYIIEPRFDSAAEAVGTVNPAYQGKGSGEEVVFEGKPVAVKKTTTVVVARWPIIEYIYLPAYRPWLSPWYFGYYPGWWRPWRPFYWHEYWGYHYHHYNFYFGHYHRWHYYHHYQARVHYAGKLRSTSHVVVERRKAGAFRETYTHPHLKKVGLEKARTVRREERHATIRKDRNRTRIDNPGEGRKPKVGGNRTIRSRQDAKDTRIVKPGRRTGEIGMKRPPKGRPEKGTSPGAASRPAPKVARKNSAK